MEAVADGLEKWAIVVVGSFMAAALLYFLYVGFWYLLAGVTKIAHLVQEFLRSVRHDNFSD